jgi:hypothetical protein
MHPSLFGRDAGAMRQRKVARDFALHLVRKAAAPIAAGSMPCARSCN